MSKILLLTFALATLAACESTPQTSALQLPGDHVRNGLQVPPDVDARPPQTAATPAR